MVARVPAHAHSWRRRQRHAVEKISSRPYPSWLVRGQVERRSWNDPELDEAFFRRGVPVVLTGGCPLSKELVGLWNFSYFCEHNCGGYRHFAVHYAPRSTTRFNRFYGEGLGKGGVLGLSFREFAERIRASSDTRYYLQSAVVWGKAAGSRDRKSAPGGEIDADGTEKLHHGPYGDKMASDLQNKIDWRWLTKVCKACGNKGIESVSLWAGHGGGATPIHYDMSDNFMCMLQGRKQILLFPPSDAFQLYPYRMDHPMDAFAQVDVESPDVNRFPSCSRLRGLETTLHPGEVLWLPANYWHFVKQLDEGQENISLNYWIGSTKAIREETLLRAERLARSLPPPTLEDVINSSMASLAVATHTAASKKRKQQQDVRDDELLASGGRDLSVAGGSSASIDEDREWFANWDDSGRRCVFKARELETECREHFGGDAAKACQFLSKLAEGADAPKGGEWPVNSAEHLFATQLRFKLVATLGLEQGNALLRAMARDGRLHPGLAPKVGKDAVSTVQQVTAR